MNQMAKNKAISMKRSLQGAARALVTRSYLISEHSDTKFRLAFRCKVLALKTIAILIRFKSDSWFLENYEYLEKRLENIMSW